MYIESCDAYCSEAEGQTETGALPQRILVSVRPMIRIGERASKRSRSVYISISKQFIDEKNSRNEEETGGEDEDEEDGGEEDDDADEGSGLESGVDGSESEDEPIMAKRKATAKEPHTQGVYTINEFDLVCEAWRP